MSRYPETHEPLHEALSDPGAHVTGGAWRSRRMILERHWRAPPDVLELPVDYRIDTDLRVTARLGTRTIPLDTPVALVPVSIAKPWGQEIWFTGIEARGESAVQTAGGELPLSQYLALGPAPLTGRAPLVLLKILDPRPEAVLGDLYFEAHEIKQEVYVVTRVDPAAWPDGRGRIRFGMNPALRRRYGNDAAFRSDYLAAVRRYEALRRAIDAGESADHAREAELRGAMEAFTDMRKLAVGDVVVVPIWLPHSLQHGVRVVEFQTPTYERRILSFAQRVVTQDHWDTASAVPRIRLDAPPPPDFVAVGEGAERIVDFADFRVWRVRIAAGSSFAVPRRLPYALCMAIQGNVELATLQLGPEQAALIPGTALRRESPVTLRNPAPDADATVLVAAPDL